MATNWVCMKGTLFLGKLDRKCNTSGSGDIPCGIINFWFYSFNLDSKAWSDWIEVSTLAESKAKEYEERERERENGHHTVTSDKANVLVFVYLTSIPFQTQPQNRARKLWPRHVFVHISKKWFNSNYIMFGLNLYTLILFRINLL